MLFKLIAIYNYVTCSISSISSEQLSPVIKMSEEVDKSQYLLPLDQPVVNLDVTAAFSQLNDNERLYAHYLSQSAWIGGLITLLQTSPESGPTFTLLHSFFCAQHPNNFRETALAHGFSENEINALFIYAAGVFSNAGNYKGFGDTKFIPGVEPDRLEEMLKLSPIWPELQILWNVFEMKENLYKLTQGHSCLGFPPEGSTTYFSSNCGPDDSERVQNWLKKLNLEAYNTRCFKTKNKEGQIEYEIRLASEEIGEIKCENVEGYKYKLVKGDYAPLMAYLSESLEKAIPFSNQAEALMLQAYIKSFRTGSLQEHKEGSRLWIKNKSPAIETYIGFIETYRDPAGVRGEFEGFVAVVNRPMSEKFGALVNNAEKCIKNLPWPKEFEKDKFLRPDFTSLDVLTFAGSGIPAGINIPNYDDIRQSEGFKNVALGNVIPASYQNSKTPFLSDANIKLLKKWRVKAFELQVGLHELLGHGSGKLLYMEADGSKNYPMDLINPLTGTPIEKHYNRGDTYDSRFGSMSSAYEECRAEAVGLYLSLDPSVLQIFGHEGKNADKVLYVNWLALVWAGAGRALEMWDPNRGWLQAHSQARFVITKILIQAGIVKVDQPEKNDLLISLDKDAIKEAGRNAISHFLLQMQIFKATGDVEAAKQFFMKLSEVEEPWISWRSIILANKQPRNMLIQPNTVYDGCNVNLKTYNSSIEGLIESWLDRFPNPENLHVALIKLTKADMAYFD